MAHVKLKADHFVKPPSYIIFEKAKVYKALNCMTQAIDFSGIDAAEIIQKAIDALPNGGLILIKAGRYVLTDSILLNHRIWLKGEGRATELVLADGVNKDIITSKLVPGVRLAEVKIEDMFIDGNRAKQTAGHGIHLFNPSYPVFRNLIIRRIYGRGIFMDGDATRGICGILEHITITDVGEDAFSFTYNWDYWLFGCIADEVDRHGFSLFSGAHTLVRAHAVRFGNDPAKAGNGIQIPSHGNSLIACHADTCYRHGINLYNAKRNRLIGCYAFACSQEASNTYDGIRIAGTSEYNIISGCYSGAINGPTQRYGLREEGASDYNLINGNVFKGNITGGITTVGVNTVAVDNISV